VFDRAMASYEFPDPNRIYLVSDRADETQSKFGFIGFDPEQGVPVGGFQPINLQPTTGRFGLNNITMTRDRKWLFFVFVESDGDIWVADLR